MNSQRAALLRRLTLGVPLCVASVPVCDAHSSAAADPLARFLAEPHRSTQDPRAKFVIAGAALQEEERQSDETLVEGRRALPALAPNALDRIGSRDVLTTEDVERVAAVSLNEIVQRMPSISSRPYNGADFSSPNFAIRGLPDDGLTEYILVTLDGVPANPLPYGWTAMSYFPALPEQIVGAELIKGGMAVRYSPNTVGGVLNLVTQPIPNAPLLRWRGSYGSYDFQSQIASYGATHGDFGYLVTAGFLSGDGFRDRGEFESQSVDVKLRWQLDRDRWLDTRFSYFNQRQQRPGGLSLAEYDADRFQNTRPTNYMTGDRAVASATLHQDEGHDAWNELYAWISSTSNKLDGPSGYINPTILRENTYTQWNANVGWRREQQVEAFGLDHRLHYGARASYEWLPHRKLADTPIAGGPEVVSADTDSELGALSVHVDDTFEPLERVELTVGVRAEYVPIVEQRNRTNGERFDEDFFDVLPAAGLSWSVSDEFALFASYQQSFRAPQFFGFGTASSPLDDDQELDFEDGRTIEVGARAQLGAGVGGSVTAWHSDFDDYAITVDSVYQNLGNVVADGIDFTADWHVGEAVQALDGLSLAAALTLQDSELDDAAQAANDGNQTPFAWKRKASWYVDYAFGSAWVASLDGYFVGESFADDANTETPSANGTLGLNPSRTIWNASLRKEVALRDGGRIEIALKSLNLFDEEWFLHSRLGGKIVGAPRMTFLSLGFSF